MRGYGRKSGRHPILKKIGKVVGIAVGSAVGLAVTASAIYWVVTTTKDYDVNGALNNDLSASIEVDDTQDPIDKIDPDHDKYEKPLPDANANGTANDGQIHDENGKNDPNRNEIDDPYGTFEVGKGDSANKKPEENAHEQEKEPEAAEDSDALIAASKFYDICGALWDETTNTLFL